MSKGRQIIIGFLGSFLSLAIISIAGVAGIVRYVSIRGSSFVDTADVLFFLTLGLIFLITMAPLLLWLGDSKNHAKGSLWGTIVFYLSFVIGFAIWITG